MCKYSSWRFYLLDGLEVFFLMENVIKIIVVDNVQHWQQISRFKRQNSSAFHCALLCVCQFRAPLKLIS